MHAVPGCADWSSASASLGLSVCSPCSSCSFIRGLLHGSSATTIQARTVSDVSARSSTVTAATSSAGTDQTGQWGSLTNWPIVAMHGEMLPNGNILTWGDSSQGDTADLWNPTTNTHTSIPDAFANPSCGGNNALPDGRVIAVGGGGIDPPIANTNVNALPRTVAAVTAGSSSRATPSRPGMPRRRCCLTATSSASAGWTAQQRQPAPRGVLAGHQSVDHAEQ